MPRLIRAMVILLSAGTLSAQLLPEQRVFDFQSLAAMYAKRYAPLQWKKEALKFDLLNLQPWLDRVRAAKDDLEFYEIEEEYGATLQDTHTYVYMNSTLRADLGITVDLYDGKVLIDGINRARLPGAAYPFAVGDELVSLDGKTAEEWIASLARYRAYGSPATTRRYATGAITVRSQSTYPRTGELGDYAFAVIRRANGDLQEYTMPWMKTGVPVLKAGPVPMPRAAAQPLTEEAFLESLHTWKLPESDPLAQTLDWSTEEGGEPRKFVLGSGSKMPVFRAGFPESFVARLGNASGDFQFSGTYTAGGKTIGYLRVPSFSPSFSPIPELERELDFMEKNTDGLVIDVMRNPGGGCYMFDLAAHLMPGPFYFFGEQIRVTQDDLFSMESRIDSAKALHRDDWIINVYQSYLDAYRDAFANSGGLTRPIAACSATGSTWPAAMTDNPPASIVYTKPLIILVDEFSISAADIFPSMMQDNGRGLLVGMRTSGGGGSVGGGAGGGVLGGGFEFNDALGWGGG